MGLDRPSLDAPALDAPALDAPALDIEATAAALRDWVPGQRWFGGKGRAVHAVSVESVVDLRSATPALHHVLARVDYVDGGEERYQVLLGRRDSLPSRLVHALIARTEAGTLYDAVHDGELTVLLLERIAEHATVGPLQFRAEPDAPILDTGLASRPLAAEQSNTSIVFGDSYILKMFRRVVPGTNPDLEVTRALGLAGCPYIAPTLGSIEAPLGVGGKPATLAMLQRFLRTGTDGWVAATTSVRDLYAEGDLHADEVGGDFAAESERLGEATAAVHVDLARVLPSGIEGPAATRAVATQMGSRLDAALAVVPDLRPYAAALRRTYAAVAALDEPVPVQRVHGDYHLGQVLRTDEGWVLLDFEGEPARPLAERVALMSPLRDVAGMLRSFDYAARHLLADHPTEPGLVYRAGEWAERNIASFCTGYATASGRDPRDSAVLLRAFELDKAVYEVVYEARNRPTWLPIPLGSIERLVS